MDNKKDTCGKQQVNQMDPSDVTKCRDLCDATENCNFYFINDHSWCGLYESCFKRRTPWTFGSTYRKNYGKITVVLNIHNKYFQKIDL